jgi:hypothetical protein
MKNKYNQPTKIHVNGYTGAEYTKEHQRGKRNVSREM